MSQDQWFTIRLTETLLGVCSASVDEEKGSTQSQKTLNHCRWHVALSFKCEKENYCDPTNRFQEFLFTEPP